MGSSEPSKQSLCPSHFHQIGIHLHRENRALLLAKHQVVRGAGNEYPERRRQKWIPSNDTHEFSHDPRRGSIKPWLLWNIFRENITRWHRTGLLRPNTHWKNALSMMIKFLPQQRVECVFGAVVLETGIGWDCQPEGYMTFGYWLEGWRH